MNGNSTSLSQAIAPPLLRKGDQVGILGTARKVKPEDMETCVAVLKSWGLEVAFSRTLYNEDRQFAGTDEERAEALQGMMDDTSIKAILCARGGYGTLRIIDRISFDRFLQHPKWIIGFSDVTPLLNLSAQKGIQAIHGPMAISFPGKTADESSLNYLRKILMEGGPLTYGYSPSDQSLVRPGLAEGRLMGGNLSLLSHMIGTPTDFDSKDVLLFIEDIDEYLYNLDRLTLHLRRSGKLDFLKALIVGGMTEMKDNEIPFGKTPEQIAFEHVSGFSYPFAAGFPSGHFATNYPMIIGGKCRLRVSHVNVEFTQGIV